MDTRPRDRIHVTMPGRCNFRRQMPEYLRRPGNTIRKNLRLHRKGLHLRRNSTRNPIPHNTPQTQTALAKMAPPHRPHSNRHLLRRKIHLRQHNIILKLLPLDNTFNDTPLLLQRPDPTHIYLYCHYSDNHTDPLNI